MLPSEISDDLLLFEIDSRKRISESDLTLSQDWQNKYDALKTEKKRRKLK